MPATPTDELLANSGCFTCLGMSIGDALALSLWQEISENINPAPPGETFYRISNVGDRRISSVTDDRIYQ